MGHSPNPLFQATAYKDSEPKNYREFKSLAAAKKWIRDMFPLYTWGSIKYPETEYPAGKWEHYTPRFR